MTTDIATPDLLDRFSASLAGAECLDRLRAGVIGEGAELPGPNGPVTMIYADYVASGRALRQVESFVMEEVLPFYANSHTEASFCGAHTTRLREDARKTVGALCGARTEDHAVIFSGSGATAGLNQLIHLLQVDAGTTVIVGPYEHHSNLLPWRESGAKVIELPEAAKGGPDMDVLNGAYFVYFDCNCMYECGAYLAKNEVNPFAHNPSKSDRRNTYLFWKDSNFW